MMKHFGLISISTFIIMILVSCGAKDNSNALIDTQFAPEVVDSTHILSPKTYSYLHNIKPPLGIKPVVVAVDRIEDSEMGTFADDVFDQFCRKEYSGNSFNQRGVLIVASKSPELVQVRVGKTYAVYCRMRGSAAGEDYLTMQKETPNRGIDEMCPVALRNVLRDIEDCRHLPWYKELALKTSFVHIEMFMDDVATPSESFFSQFYFRPFLYIVGSVRQIFGTWVLSFLFIAIVYTLIKSWGENKLKTYILKKVEKNSSSDEEYMENIKLYGAVMQILVFLLKFIITVPTLAAISVLSTSRLEDIIALHEANIPSVDLMGNVTHWTNNTPGLWVVLTLMVIYYLKFLFWEKGWNVWGNLSDEVQQHIYQHNNRMRMITDEIMEEGINRHSIQNNIMEILRHFLPHIYLIVVLFNEILKNIREEIETKLKMRLIDYLFLGTKASIYKHSPFLAIQINAHREALYLTAFIGLAATTVLSYTYVIYFLVLWIVQLIYRTIIEIIYMRKQMSAYIKFIDPTRLIKRVWKTDVIFLVASIVLFLILAPSYTPKTTEAVAEVQKSLPDDFTGLYFVSKAEGESAKGVTARMARDNAENYIMQVYSDKPVRRYPLSLDEEAGLFHSDILGDGYIIYDEQTKSITINFSDLWVLTN